MRKSTLLALLAAFPILAATQADDPRRYVRIESGGAGGIGCSGPQVVVNKSSQHYIRVTITDHYDAAGYGSGTGNSQYRLGPSERQGIGCHMSSRANSALTVHDFSIANAVFAD